MDRRQDHGQLIADVWIYVCVCVFGWVCGSALPTYSDPPAEAKDFDINPLCAANESTKYRMDHGLYYSILCQHTKLFFSIDKKTIC